MKNFDELPAYLRALVRHSLVGVLAPVRLPAPVRPVRTPTPE